MVIHDCIQGEPEWYRARCGVFTASTFGRVLTPKTHKPSVSRFALENRIVAEKLTGDPIDDDESFGGSKWTERGKLYEPKAVELYELATGEETARVGFITNDAGTIGGSPDRLVGIHGGLEIKCLAPINHTSLFFGDDEEEVTKFEAKHIPQIQGLMWITGRKWWDVFFYHPKIKPFRRRYERDVLYIAKLETTLNAMVENVAKKLAKMKEE